METTGSPAARIVAFLIGWAILRAVALIPVLDLLWFAAVCSAWVRWR